MLLFVSLQLPLIQPLDEPTCDMSPCATDWEFPTTPDVGNLQIIGDYQTHFERVKVSKDDAIFIERNTHLQAVSDLWKKERQQRLTSSDFGRIMNRKSMVNQKCIDSIMNRKPFFSAPPAMVLLKSQWQQYSTELSLKTMCMGVAL